MWNAQAEALRRVWGTSVTVPFPAPAMVALAQYPRLRVQLRRRVISEKPSELLLEFVTAPGTQRWMPACPIA